MISIIVVIVLIVGAIVIAGWIKKKKEIDKGDSDGTIHPR